MYSLSTDLNHKVSYADQNFVGEHDYNAQLKRLPLRLGLNSLLMITYEKRSTFSFSRPENSAPVEGFYANKKFNFFT